MNAAALNPLRRAEQRGRDMARAEIVGYLRAQAAVHTDGPGDAIRRGAINHAADRVRDRMPVGRPTPRIPGEKATPEETS